MQEDILIGTLVQGNRQAESYIRQILPHGFESIAITFGDTFTIDPEELAEKIMPMLQVHQVRIGAISLYCNPLKADDSAAKAQAEFARLIDCAHLFETDVVSGFTGRVPDCPIPESIPRFKEVWGGLAERAAQKNVRIAWENCPMGGTWARGSHNIAHNPAAWELMFAALPLPNVGLEWEPCHQMVQLIDPLPQLRQWAGRIFHVHGKDASILKDVIARDGISSPKAFAYHRTPGFGDSNWADIISELRRSQFKGSIDIEGWHDQVYGGKLEMTGQVHGLHYLKFCRGENYIPCPVCE